MDARQVGALLKQIDTLYPNRLKLDPSTVEVWHYHLKDENFEIVLSNFKKHARNNIYPPTIAELVDNSKSRPSLEPFDFTKIFSNGDDPE
jgi:hypothetical protein